MKSDQFQENLKKLMGDDSKASFAQKCGFSVGALTNYLNGSIPSADKAIRIAEIFGVNVQWLVTGEGPQYPGTQNAAPLPSNVQVLPEAEGFQRVPVLDVRGSAGDGAMNFGEVISGFISLPVSYLKDHLGANPKDVCGIYINGDSMEPALEDGGIALLDRSENARSNKGDGIYTFRIGEELYIKRLERQGSRIVVHSDNPAYSPWEISDHDKANMKILARVVGTFRNL
jgi:phage repressor protein C with HTH and peptisase S24 domain